MPPILNIFAKPYPQADIIVLAHKLRQAQKLRW
jgi:hypothetical protein